MDSKEHRLKRVLTSLNVSKKLISELVSMDLEEDKEDMFKILSLKEKINFACSTLEELQQERPEDIDDLKKNYNNLLSRHKNLKERHQNLIDKLNK
jgi:FtsZ-binding cell division protein ZapB